MTFLHHTTLYIVQLWLKMLQYMKNTNSMLKGKTDCILQVRLVKISSVIQSIQDAVQAHVYYYMFCWFWFVQL